MIIKSFPVKFYIYIIIYKLYINYIYISYIKNIIITKVYIKNVIYISKKIES